MGKIYKKMCEEKRVFIHVTEYENIPNILENGGILSLQEIEKENIDVVYVTSEDSRENDKKNGIGKYVRLAYTEHYDMLAAAIYNQKLKNPAIILVKPEILKKTGIKYTTENAAKKGSVLYDNEDEIFEKLDFEKIYLPRNSTNAGIQEYKNARQSEVLIPDIVESEFFLGILIPKGSDKSKIKGDSSIELIEMNTKETIHP